MIRLTPYYEREDADEILKLYLAMVAKAVPFFSEDVLDEDESRTHNNMQRGRAIRAETRVYQFSEKLFDFLFRTESECLKDGHVNRDHLLGLLLMKPLDYSGIPNDDNTQAIKEIINEKRNERIYRTIESILADLIHKAYGKTILRKKKAPLDCENLEKAYQNWIKDIKIDERLLSLFVEMGKNEQNGEKNRIRKSGEENKKISIGTLLETTIAMTKASSPFYPPSGFEKTLYDKTTTLLGGIIEKEAGEELLDYVFCYDRFSKGEGAYRFAEKLGAVICPYCNRLFTTTLLPKLEEEIEEQGSDEEKRNYEKEVKKKTKKNKTGGIRPQFDHYMNKSSFPFLALSINNLIPCCGVCNLTKHDTNALLLYPYAEGMENDCSFRAESKYGAITQMLQGTRVSIDTFEIKMEIRDIKDTNRKERIKASIAKLRLEDLYQSHKAYVAEIFYQRHIVTEDYVKSIHEQFPELYPTVEDVWTTIRLMNIAFPYWGDRPLAKLTHDINKEIDMLCDQARYETLNTNI